MQDKITKNRLEKEFDITKRALKAIKLSGKNDSEAKKLLDFAQRYFKDAEHFKKQGDWASAFGALNYAHAWLDAGARSGIFKVKDKELFTVD